LRIAIAVLWGALAVYWLIAAAGAKRGSRRGRSLPGLTAITAVIVLRVSRGSTPTEHSAALQAIGRTLVAAGLGLAVWARIYLGRNWGMPMTRKEQPELVTSGPYRFVRHPIYSGLLLGMLGTAVATSPYWLIAIGIMGAYFLYSARVEERLMSASFPNDYAAYRARTKMLIPFVL
jgi:protein-S-isoprenylcysteine O-methyltransferase Ste14